MSDEKMREEEVRDYIENRFFEKAEHLSEYRDAKDFWLIEKQLFNNYIKQIVAHIKENYTPKQKVLGRREIEKILHSMFAKR